MDKICAATDMDITSAIRHDEQDDRNNNGYDKASGDLYACMRPILILGRVLGILPISGVFMGPDVNDDKVLTYHLGFGWVTFPVLCSLVVLLLLGANMALSFLNLFQLFADEGAGGSASQLAIAARDPMFYLMSFLVYAFFLLRANDLLKLFVKWRVVSDDLRFQDNDAKLFEHIVILTGSIFGFGIFENILYAMNNFPLSGRGANAIVPADQTAFEENLSSLETYFWRSHPFWAKLLSYDTFFALILMFVNTLAAYSWTFGDLFIVLCSRALYYKFKILVDQTNLKLLGRVEDDGQDGVCFRSTRRNKSVLQWSQVRKDHLTLCKLLDEFESFLSPLIFLSYSTNIFFICLEIHQGLTPQNNSSLFSSAYSFISFVYLLLRVLVVSIMAAKVNEYVHQITICTQKCATNEYCSELERLEMMLAASPIGLQGLGCFVVTRAFLLMVVSVVFTVEIVLLQSSATATTLAQVQGFNTSTEIPHLRT
ncbi:gustatory receptor for sugar taste 64e-like [Folsomia candida]|uniref:gustatory receptor for sugar taste 64e-like n=1 Tax=Folsomia candida TaxID=158441 RepID=UPI0016055ADC|nr:gustatory receptor for sugar taste 64e-like [Folsomia candida]